ncbi:hypothetical protein M8C13_40425 [Crossiella sp. SN42]|uniref:deazapurine DNA modification protein DpdA family protein n=1 Tax=Crossiella sp. SN42 TaxID=2944808 RepID=UPI00207D1309|nr:hypothetical protein [Crossiella sp. SN42]MCO1582034.1 hypothetical protein [Crossiella sp. SN42]
MSEPTFLLGTHQPSWFPRAGVPLFVSDSRLRARRTFPRAAAPWCLDSSGFTQLQQHGRWTFTPQQYIDRALRYSEEIGRLRWIAPMDHMCEWIVRHGGRLGRMVFAGTGLSTEAHLNLTVDSVAQLRDLARGRVHVIPVVQGDQQEDYERCALLYERAGFDLTREPVVGLGSVCRRQGTVEAHRIIQALHAHGIRNLHGFGVKTLGLLRYGHLLTSADSLAWSDDARRKQRPACGQVHPRGAKNCANCLPYALSWRTRLLARLAGQARQGDLFDYQEAA